MKIRTVVALATAAVLAAATPASASTPAYKGTGWKIMDQYGVYATSPTQQFTVTFQTQEIKDRWADKLTTAITQLNTLGIHIQIGGIYNHPQTYTCAPKGQIHFMEKYQPIGQSGFSQGLPCYNTIDHSSWGGIVFMTSEYGDGTRTLTYNQWRNFPTHEMGHAMGLDHPNDDAYGDHDGVTEGFECPFGTEGATPVMCSPNGGFRSTQYAGRLSDQDRAGFTQLLTNASILGIS